MNAQIKPMSIINENATKILVQEIGIVDTIRFINQFSFGCGNYTEERRKTVDTMSLDEIIAGIENMKKQLN
ncbi:MAG: hypothetical protein WAX77_16315 [Methylococcaceae bacterium]